MDWDDPMRPDIEKKINDIEQFCIEKGYGGITKLTVWGNMSNNESPNYPYHTGFVNLRDIPMVGELNGTGLNYNADKSIHHCKKCLNI
jgi:hypothetical protein